MHNDVFYMPSILHKDTKIITNQSAEGAAGLGMLMSTIVFWSGVMSTFDFGSGDYVQVGKKNGGC